MFPAQGPYDLDPGQDANIYYHPFSFEGAYLDGVGLPPRALNELMMMKLSATIRDKPSWWTKFTDKAIKKKWKDEALPRKIKKGKLALTEEEVDYVLAELKGYKALYDPITGIQVSCTDGVWQSDTLIPPALRSALLGDILKLEDIPDGLKDWHPRSNNQVLDIVHPSLYCLVYGRTLAFPNVSEKTDPGKLAPILSHSEVAYYRDSAFCISNKFAWIPTDFTVSANGKEVSALGYINNLHPSNSTLYRSLESTLALFVPLFERVLTDIHISNDTLSKVRTSIHSYDPNLEPPYRSNDEDDSDEDYAEEPKRSKKKKEKKVPRRIPLPAVPAEGYQGSLEKREHRVSLKGTTIQVIVKLANIHLTPDNPSYDGGNWHVEGMMNEHIAASGIYYYLEENITQSSLSFRTAVSFPKEGDQHERVSAMDTWGFHREEPANQELGSVITKEGRCIAFPNLFQHRVSPFKLLDPTRPGYRKILVFFLVDPSIPQPIPSTSVIPPQQKEWAIDELKKAPRSHGLNKLPLELLNMINEEVELMSREEAKSFRLELMDERTKFVKDHDSNFFSVQFNMCEH